MEGKNRRYGSAHGRGPQWIALPLYNPELGPSICAACKREGLKIIPRLSSSNGLVGAKAVCVFLFSQSDDTLTASQQGLPVQVLDTTGWKEGAGLDPIAGAVALMDKPAHPNAAKVLLNWLLSREGQLAVQKTRACRTN